MEKKLKSPKDIEIKALNQETVGLNVLVHPIEYEKHKDILDRPNVWNLRLTLEGRFAYTKDDETRVLNMVLDANDHPWQGVVIATNKEMEEKHGLKVGSVINCGRALVESRSFIKHNGIVFPMITLHQVFSIKAHVELEKEELLTIKL